MSNVLRQNKLAVYRLKRNYGLPAVIYKPDTTAYTFDIETGRQQREWITQSLRRIIRLPHDIARLFKYDLSFIAANKNFTYGGFYDVDSRLFIIDRADLGDFELDENSHIEAEGFRYEVTKFFDVEELAAYMVSTKSSTGNLPVTQQEPSPSN